MSTSYAPNWGQSPISPMLQRKEIAPRKLIGDCPQLGEALAWQ